MKLIFILLLTVMWLPGSAQQPQTVMAIDTTQQSREYWNKWLNDLFDMGVERKNDSVYVKEEVIKLVRDSAYRNSIYPAKYDWPLAVNLLKAMELKKAFWHLINIYMTDTARRNMVLGTFIVYDSLMEMDKMLINAYYTYAFTDPRVCRIKNNKPDIYRPDLLEKHLNTTKEIINKIQYYRREKAAKKKNSG
jgi:hypothetical protein